MSQQYGKLAKRYAKALLQAVVREQGSAGSPSPAQALAGQLSGFARLWNEVPELSGTIVNPMFDKSERLRALLEVAARAGASGQLPRFLQVVFERERIAALPEMAAAFAELADTAAGMVQVGIAVAREVQHEEMRSIEADLKSRIPGNLSFSWRIEPELIGGMVVTYAGKVLDGSVRGRLERIERKLRGESVVA